MLKELEDYDWREAFEYANNPAPSVPGDKVLLDPIIRENVVEIRHIQEGENDGPPWLLVGKVKDGRWFFLEAGCDYSGWG